MRTDQMMHIVAGTLTGAIPAGWALYKIPVYGPTISTAFQTATAIACLGADTSLQTQQGIAVPEDWGRYE